MVTPIEPTAKLHDTPSFLQFSASAGFSKHWAEHSVGFQPNPACNYASVSGILSCCPLFTSLTHAKHRESEPASCRRIPNPIGVGCAWQLSSALLDRVQGQILDCLLVIKSARLTSWALVWGAISRFALVLVRTTPIAEPRFSCRFASLTNPFGVCFKRHQGRGVLQMPAEVRILVIMCSPVTSGKSKSVSCHNRSQRIRALVAVLCLGRTLSYDNRVVRVHRRKRKNTTPKRRCAAQSHSPCVPSYCSGRSSSRPF